MGRVRGDYYKYHYSNQKYAETIEVSNPGERKKVFKIPVIVANPDYEKKIAQTKSALQTDPLLISAIIEGEISRAGGSPDLDTIAESNRPPSISKVILYPHEDVIVTAQGEVRLDDFDYVHKESGLRIKAPRTLRDFYRRNEAIEQLLQRVIVPAYEILQIIDLEKRLSETEPYREILPIRPPERQRSSGGW